MKPQKPSKELGIEEIIEVFRNWQVKIPKYIRKLTKDEVYIHGFSSGYKCKLAELENKCHNVTPTFCFIKKAKQ